MKRILSLALVTTLLSGCGEKVEVPPAYVGKILTHHGYQEGFIDPSTFRLESCFTYCDKLITLQASDGVINEDMELFMPKDELKMSFSISATVRISRDEKNINDIFDRVPADENNNISLEKVYSIYAEQKFRSVSRAILASYKIDEIAENRELVESVLFNKLQDALKDTPIKIVQLGLTNVAFPDVITLAKENAKKREIEIQQAEADKQVALVRAGAELEIARKNRLVRLERAKTIKEENELTSASVTEAYLKYKQLEVFEQIAKSGSAIYIPLDTKLVLMGKGTSNVPQ